MVSEHASVIPPDRGWKTGIGDLATIAETNEQKAIRKSKSVRIESMGWISGFRRWNARLSNQQNTGSSFGASIGS
ncbi:MAG: hypothetical protein BWY82_01630 [Verrucomicrobia bacterium ADurb.Bin474]|nr:MAG: hypothetical protein BWY82_01630 [Verrucomicrobia bacterium ADurb.Bin474]